MHIGKVVRQAAGLVELWQRQRHFAEWKTYDMAIQIKFKIK